MDLRRICVAVGVNLTSQVVNLADEICKEDIIKSDYESLLSSATTHPSTKHTRVTIAESTSWLQLWDLGLDQGVKGTRCLQTPLKALSYRIFNNFTCPSCNAILPANTLLLEHMCQMHTEAVNHMSHQESISSLVLAEAGSIFSCKLYSLCVLFCGSTHDCGWVVDGSNAMVAS